MACKAALARNSSGALFPRVSSCTSASVTNDSSSPLPWRSRGAPVALPRRACRYVANPNLGFSWKGVPPDAERWQAATRNVAADARKRIRWRRSCELQFVVEQHVVVGSSALRPRDLLRSKIASPHSVRRHPEPVDCRSDPCDALPCWLHHYLLTPPARRTPKGLLERSEPPTTILEICTTLSWCVEQSRLPGNSIDPGSPQRSPESTARSRFQRTPRLS